MLDENEIMPFNFFAYGGKYSGQHGGMRYLIERDGEKPDFILRGNVWQGPYASCSVPKEKISSKEFDYSEEGRLELIDWLKDQYDTRLEEWDSAPSILEAEPYKH
ncbi:hypothetical protein [Lachnospira multipara]|uniref:GNAT family acetyltransferase n=1 Tax=Lachnospira multipara TaxID=28051 RepID=A0A1H5RUY9_9FIRM|nr:hypothetical protein [Lachnospira multipara]MBQ2473031.1 hypothetical protein [Lachnospira sp.]SEF41944.1 hypothetical protein SAMN05216537_101299 [Lachnospira multipara]